MGEVVYTKSYNYADTEQSIDLLQVGKKESGEYLIYFGHIGNSKTPIAKIIAKKEGKIQEMAELRGWCEFADLNNDGMNEIIITSGEIRTVYENGTEKQIFPDSAKVYGWQQGELKLLRAAPWKKRLYEK
ncbi:MAG: hypothetical protein L0Z48_05265 [candidate division Zixibacteria bacterium]|nr:hypothetical protein [candidate division Zixibacteria bacterium]